MAKKRKVAIFLFDDVEVLDFAGPFEVFNVTSEVVDPAPFEVFTVSEDRKPIQARGNLLVIPSFSMQDCPRMDILIIPGGWGTRPLIDNQAVIDWLQLQAQHVEFLLSVCTGSLVLARAGLLDGLKATTHHTALDRLKREAPQTHVVNDSRFVDNGRVITSGGISAGIDMSLYVVHNLLGGERLQKTLDEMEYTWSPEVER